MTGDQKFEEWKASLPPDRGLCPLAAFLAGREGMKEEAAGVAELRGINQNVCEFTDVREEKAVLYRYGKQVSAEIAKEIKALE
jgi:hypothetical protein